MTYKIRSDMGEFFIILGLMIFTGGAIASVFSPSFGTISFGVLGLFAMILGAIIEGDSWR